MMIDWDEEAFALQWEEYRENGAAYETPLSCYAARPWLPRAGESHIMRGVWPPDLMSQKPHLAETITEYHDCQQWGVLPRGGGLHDQCSWTMGAFRIIANAKAEITKAQWEHDRWKNKPKKGK